jgi:hypothetical protein
MRLRSTPSKLLLQRQVFRLDMDRRNPMVSNDNNDKRTKSASRNKNRAGKGDRAVTDMSIRTEIDNITEFEELAKRCEDVPSAVALLD